MHVDQLWEIPEQFVLYLVGDVVSPGNGQVPSDPYVHIDVKCGAHFTGTATFHFYDIRDFFGNFSYACTKPGFYGFIQQFAYGGPTYPVSVIKDEPCGDQGRKIVRDLKSVASYQCNGNPYKSGNGGDSIAPMVEGVRFDSGTVDLLPGLENVPVQKFLGKDDKDQNGKRKRRGAFVRLHNMENTIMDDNTRSDGQGDTDSDRLSLIHISEPTRRTPIS